MSAALPVKPFVQWVVIPARGSVGTVQRCHSNRRAAVEEACDAARRAAERRDEVAARKRGQSIQSVWSPFTWSQAKAAGFQVVKAIVSPVARV